MSKDFKTREDWLAYRARKPKRITWIFVSVKPDPRHAGEFIGATYKANRTKHKNKKWETKIAARNARRAAKQAGGTPVVAARNRPVEAVPIE